jgi:hypothetical protein
VRSSPGALARTSARLKATAVSSLPGLGWTFQHSSLDVLDQLTERLVPPRVHPHRPLDAFAKLLRYPDLFVAHLRTPSFVIVLTPSRASYWGLGHCADEHIVMAGARHRGNHPSLGKNQGAAAPLMSVNA